MRIPVSQSDLESKSFSRLSKTLRKRWILKTLSSMQAQNLMATFLGYRDLHDLQSNLSSEIRLDYKAKSRFSRTEVENSIAWDISRRHPISYGSALALVQDLPLKIMDFDKLTSDRKTEAFLEAERLAGRFMMIDEMGFYMNGPRWFQETPLLLEAGAPPFKFVILPTGQAIRWSNIQSRVEQLPSDLAARIRVEPEYRDSTSDRDGLISFYRREILPEVAERAPEAILADRELAPGFEVQAYSERSLVLYNKSLGGLIPVAYDAHSMKIFEDMATIMTNGVVQFGGQGFIPDSRKQFWFECHGPANEPVVGKWFMSRFLESSFSGAQPGIARTFVERGHEYIRCQEWMDEEYLPRLMQGWVDLRTKPAVQSTEAIPRWHRDFHYQALSAINMRAIHAQRQLSRAIVDGRLADLILKLAGDPSLLESMTHEQIKSHHVEPDENPEEISSTDLDSAQDSLADAAACYREAGEDVVSAFPALLGLGATTLGWLLYQHHDVLYDDRDSWLVGSFDKRDEDGVRGFFTYLVYHFVGLAYGSGRAGYTTLSPDAALPALQRQLLQDDRAAQIMRGTFTEPRGLGKPLQILVCQVLEGECDARQLSGDYLRLSQFYSALRAQETRIQNIVEWRRKMDAIAEVSRNSEWLYAGEKVATAPPESPYSHLMEMRKYGSQPISAIQDMSDLEPSCISSLFALARST